MASEHRIIPINDRNPKRVRLRHYKRVYRGDVIRVHRVTEKPANEVLQAFSLGREASIKHLDPDLISINANSIRGSNVISRKLGEGSETISVPDNTTPPPMLPDVPQNLVASTISSTQANVTWDPAANATSYNLEYDTDPGFGAPTSINVSVTNVNINFLTPGTTYYFRVNGENALGVSLFSAVDSTITAPGQVINLTATAVSTTQINTSWSAQAGAATYDLEYADNPGFSSSTTVNTASTSAMVMGLDPDTGYFFRVSGVNAGGNGPVSAVVGEPTDTPVPAAPLGFTFVANGETGINAAWNAVTYADSYNLEYDTDPGFGTATSVNVAGLSHPITGLDPATLYYGRVNAESNNSGVGAFSSTETATTDLPLPAVPTGLVLTPVSESEISASWDSVTHAADYDMQWDVDPGFGTAVTDTTAATTLSATPLLTSTLYYIRVRSKNATGNSAWSTAESATTFGTMFLAVLSSNTGASNNDQYTFPQQIGNSPNFTMSVEGSATADIVVNSDAVPTTFTFAEGAGAYTIKIVGQNIFPEFNGVGDPLKMTDISDFGDSNLIYASYKGCANMQVTASNGPTIGAVDIGESFSGCTALTGGVGMNSWDTSLATGTFQMFFFCENFNTSLSTWDLGSALTTQDMFRDAALFNSAPPVITSTTTDIRGMFWSTSFNQLVDTWNVTSVTRFDSLFRNCPFNRPLNTWSLNSVTDMFGMFFNNVAFNSAIFNIPTSNIVLTNCFGGATSFNQPIPWSTNNVVSITGFLNGASSFDQNLGSMNLQNVTSLDNFISNSGMSNANYNLTMDGWVSAGWVKPNAIAFGADSLVADPTSGAVDGTAARQTLEDTYSWSITDATPTPAQVVNLALSVVNATTLQATWDAAANALTYFVEWDDDPGFGSPSDATTAGLSQNITVTEGVTYYVRVTSFYGVIPGTVSDTVSGSSVPVSDFVYRFKLDGNDAGLVGSPTSPTIVAGIAQDDLMASSHNGSNQFWIADSFSDFFSTVGNGANTITGWVNTSSGSSGFVWGGGSSENANGGGFIRYNASGTLTIRTRGTDRQTSGTVNGGTWKFFAYRSNGASLGGSWWIDNAQDSTFTSAAYNWINENQMKIGSTPTGGPPVFNGLIDDIRLYDRHLSDSELQEIFNYT